MGDEATIDEILDDVDTDKVIHFSISLLSFSTQQKFRYVISVFINVGWAN